MKTEDRRPYRMGARARATTATRERIEEGLVAAAAERLGGPALEAHTKAEAP